MSYSPTTGHVYLPAIEGAFFYMAADPTTFQRRPGVFGCRLRGGRGQQRPGLAARAEQAGRRGHAESLVRPLMVIGVHPGGDRRLR